MKSRSTILSRAEYFLIPFKFFLIFCLLLWIAVWIAQRINPRSKALKKTYETLDHILFWGVIVILLMIAPVFLLAYRQHLGYALLYPFLDRNSKRMTGYDVCIPRFYTSLMLWLMLYLVVLSFLAIISKLTNKDYLLYAF